MELEEKGLTSTDAPEKPRDTWGRRAEFLLSCISLAVGLGNIWRFPWLAQKNGGGAFLIPYFVMLILEGIPLFCLELCIGQRMRLGPIPLWRKVSPLSSGIGFSMCLTAFVVACFYNVIISMCLLYLYKSFFNPLPWSSCPSARTKNSSTPVPACEKIGPSLYYYYYEALKIGENINDTSGLNSQLTIALLIAWVVVFLCMIKGIRSSGKVAYFIGVAPYFILLVFLVQGLTLEGYQDGLRHFFLPKWERLRDPMVWLEAASQIFFSLGVGYGGLIAYASYNPSHQSPYKDTLVITLINSGTSIFAGTVIFSMLGYRANMLMKKCASNRYATVTSINRTMTTMMKHGYNVSSLSEHQLRDLWQKLLSSGVTGNMTWPECDKSKFLTESSGGTGLAFIAFAEAMNHLPIPNFFSVIFFLMLVILGLGSMFGSLEGLTTSLRDMKVFRNTRKEFVSLLVAVFGFGLGIIFTQFSGEYMIQLLNSYSADIPPLIIALCELLTVSYIIGINNFGNEMLEMTGRKLSIFWKLMWSVISPMTVVTIFVAFTILSSKKLPMYEVWDRTSVSSRMMPYPPWALVVGIGITVLCVLPILVGIIKAVLLHFGTFTDTSPEERSLGNTDKKCEDTNL